MKNIENNLQTIFIKVDEPIQKVHLKAFILTSLKLNSITLKNKELICYFYIPELNSYEIVIYQNKEADFLRVNSYFHSNKTDDIVVYLYTNLLLLFKDGRLYYIQKLQYILSSEDIEKLILNKLSIKVKKIKTLADNELNANALDKKLFYKNIERFGKNNSKHTLLFFLYSLMVLTIVSFYIYKNNFSNEELQNNLHKKQLELTNLIHSKQRNLEAVALLELFKKVQGLNISLKSLTYEQKLYSLVLEAKQEKSLYEFISLYKNVKVEKLQYIPLKRSYELHVQISKL